jgi:molybdate transport system substrate-binding protein
MRGATRLGAIFATLILLSGHTATRAAEIKIISGPATSAVLTAIAQQFERDTGHKFTSKGGVTGELKRLIESDEAFDLALIPGPLMDEFASQGKFAADTRVQLARVGMGAGVRAGSSKPDIASVEKFKSALLSAKAITFVPTGETGAHLTSVFNRLGITEEMRAKSKPQQTAPASIQLVADGEADLVFLLSTVLAGGKGIEFAGLFPADLQHFVVINAAVSSAAKEADAAKALIKYLTSNDSAPIIKSKGLEPIGR